MKKAIINFIKRILIDAILIVYRLYNKLKTIIYYFLVVCSNFYENKNVFEVCDHEIYLLTGDVSFINFFWRFTENSTADIKSYGREEVNFGGVVYENGKFSFNFDVTINVLTSRFNIDRIDADGKTYNIRDKRAYTFCPETILYLPRSAR